jgi:superfamily I DNA/RNA helicase
MVADEGQGIYERGFTFPDPDDGWVRAELVSNCRNAAPIARILRRKLGGAPAPAISPEGLGVSWQAADDLDTVTALVDAEIQRLEDEGRSMSGVCVATFRSAVRDHLRSELDLSCWEDRVGGGVLCENVHRLKGLEFDTVILATPDDEDDLTRLYVGVSRAVSELITVGPPPLAARLGLA